MHDTHYKIGIDIGSTTLKAVVLDPEHRVVYRTYRRHKTDISGVLCHELQHIEKQFQHATFSISMTGSAGMGISERHQLPFIQEVVASVHVVQTVYPQTRILIDLGGEDAKMVFFNENTHPDIRMNGSCAGGTGSFIDQMADLMHISVDELGEQALRYEKIYPVASRCGVFAKTDVQNLISRNVPTADLAMSILHTVALQSITSLARGCDIRPPILCIGGPLSFLPALRQAFREQLHVDESEFILPENSPFFPAWGAALQIEDEAAVCDLSQLIRQLQTKPMAANDGLPPLFTSPEAYEQWKTQRQLKSLPEAPVLVGETVDCFLGIDSGSTTTKIVVLDADGRILYRFYDRNEGSPLQKVFEGLQQFYTWTQTQSIRFRFKASCATGYGEDLVRSALNLDFGIVETMAHLTGAQYIDPKVSFILDIGGQDIKSIFTHQGVISQIELNEACSSGCGSFLQNFASTMNLSMEAFTAAACEATTPCDLGSRCTVFMNSRVKQALRENASLGDIAAGLAYSVVKNCLYKVLKISNLNHLGDHIVVQGGTFRNDAVYRALELLSGKTISSTDSPELMGAFGAALYARSRWLQEPIQTFFTGEEALPDLKAIDTKELHCKGCTNRCSVLRFRFPNGNTAYAGNKCEKIFFNARTARQKGYNAFDDKNRILFEFPKRPKWIDRPTVIGIPRVLNLFEDYPFWHTLFTECGFRVVLSPESNYALYQRGAGYVMSDNICFPAKIAHGHILALSDQKVDRIFYPIVPKEDKEFANSSNSYNCPVVSGYPEVVRSSMDPAERFGIPFDKPVIPFHNRRVLERACRSYLETLDVSHATFKHAFIRALAIRKARNKELILHQRRRFEQAAGEGKLVFVVTGRPYHADPLINQKVGQILSDLGAEVFTDDVFRRTDHPGFSELKIVSQWAYPNRVIQAAMEVARLPQNVQLIQLNSFGCGPDSFFMDEAHAILRKAGKNHTVLRIDEIASPGSIRLRLRSLIESLKTAPRLSASSDFSYQDKGIAFTREDREKTILAPWFSDFISPFIPALGELAGYHIVNLPPSSKRSAEAGLRYGHNEVCYPSTLVLGDIITALQSGQYDLSNTAVAITQTGGQCRATNYISQIKAGLAGAGLAHIPVIVLSGGEVFQNEQPGFKIPLRKLLNITAYALLYADSLQQMYNSTIVRERQKGSTQTLFDHYITQGIEVVRANRAPQLLELMQSAVQDFNALPVYDRDYPCIGLIGEIYVKYNHYGQAYTTEWLRDKGIDVVTPPILDFLMQYFVNSPVNETNGIERGSLSSRLLRSAFWRYLNVRIRRIERILQDFRYYRPSVSIFTKAQYAAEILDLSNQFGEGWMLAAEVAHFARQGINKVVCVQPFGCIANHIVAKGIEKRLKKFYPNIDLLYLDIDGGMAEVNLQNRLHFML